MSSLTRVPLRVGIYHHATTPEVLQIGIRADRFALLRFLPDRYDVDGDLVAGLTIVTDPDGARRVSYCGTKDVLEYDYLQLPIRFAGFDAREHMAPVDGVAWCEPGIVVVDPIPETSWIPAEASRDVRVIRVLDMFARNVAIDDIVARLTRVDRAELDALLAGQVTAADVAPHVAIVATRMKR